MTRIDLEIHEDAVSAVNKIKNINDSGIELIIPEGSVLFESIFNLRLIKTQAEKQGITIQFTTEDETGLDLISIIEDNEVSGFSSEGIETDALPESNQYPEDEMGNMDNNEFNSQNSRPRINIGLPDISKITHNIRMPNLKFRKGLIILPIILILLGGYMVYGKTKPQAEATIKLSSQSLTRSITIKVSSDKTTSPEDKILRGTKIVTTVEETVTTNTTGEKQVGKKASGKITLYNKTEEEIEMDKGDIVQFEKDDINYDYLLKDDVTIPARTEDPVTLTITPGTADVEVEAKDIGDKFNIEDGEDLDVDGYKNSAVVGKTKEEIDGGESKAVKIFAEEDKTTLQKQISDTVKEKANADLLGKVSSKQELIKGSTTVVITKEEYDKKVGDETTEVKLTQTAEATGLLYLKADLDTLLDKLVADLIPEGFKLSKEERDVKVEILGNTTDSILTSTEADIQVTLKTDIIPNINQDEIKNNLKGKSLKEAQELIGGLRDVQEYSFKLDPMVPFFQKVPNDPNRIKIEIVND